MITTTYIVDSLQDVSYQQAVAIISRKVKDYVNEHNLVFLDFSYTIHETSPSSKLITFIIVYRKPNREHADFT